MGRDLSTLTEEEFIEFCNSRSFELDSYSFGKQVVSFSALNGLVLAPERREREKISTHYGQHPGFDTHRAYITSSTEVDTHFWLYDPSVGEYEIDLPKLDISVREGHIVTLVYALGTATMYLRKKESRVIPVAVINHSTNQQYLLATPSEIRDGLKLRDHFNLPTFITPVVILAAWIGSLAINHSALIMIFGCVALIYALMARLFSILDPNSFAQLGFTFDWPMFWMEHKTGLESMLNRHVEWLTDPSLVVPRAKLEFDPE